MVDGDYACDEVFDLAQENSLVHGDDVLLYSLIEPIDPVIPADG